MNAKQRNRHRRYKARFAKELGRLIVELLHSIKSGKMSIDEAIAGATELQKELEDLANETKKPSCTQLQ